MTDLEDKLRTILEHAAAARQSCAEADRHCTAVERLLGELASAGKGQTPLARAWRIIENSRVRYVTEDEAEELREGSTADLVLDCERRRLRYVPADSRKRGPIWVNPKWGWFKALLVGMSKPGRPFGNLRINQVFSRHAEILPRTLSRDIAGLTKLLQNGGTKGPYILREHVDSSVSNTSWGYLFSSRWNYLVIERNTNAAI